MDGRSFTNTDSQANMGMMTSMVAGSSLNWVLVCSKDLSMICGCSSSSFFILKVLLFFARLAQLLVEGADDLLALGLLHVIGEEVPHQDRQARS